MDEAHLLGRQSWNPDELMERHPPQLGSPHKRAVYELCAGRSRGVPVEVTRWRAMPLPAEIGAPIAIDAREDVFGYEPADPATVAWWLNFADRRLFFAYGSPLFAQDEMQVAEHPVLGSVREALVALDRSELEPVTRTTTSATPVLVRNAERRCAIATAPDASAGRPRGLYGNRFAAASLDAVRRATRVLVPPALSNILAIQAPAGGRGSYSLEDIHDIVTTAYTGFRAARAESGVARTVVHTGHWGCGAFGGNRVLMAVLQVLAARAAGLDRIVYHTVDASGSAALREADGVLAELGDGALEPALAKLARRGFAWGVSDGN
jgi:hypothetical protein